jgi:hypothetical protein
MARKGTTSKMKIKPDCQDCKHSYEPHCKALDGHMILCRCPFDTEHSHFMKRDGCDRFQIKH